MIVSTKGRKCPEVMMSVTVDYEAYTPLKSSLPSKIFLSNIWQHHLDVLQEKFVEVQAEKAAAIACPVRRSNTAWEKFCGAVEQSIATQPSKRNADLL